MAMLPLDALRAVAIADALRSNMLPHILLPHIRPQEA